MLLLYGDMVDLLLAVEETSARSGRVPVYDDARCETRRRNGDNKLERPAAFDLHSQARWRMMADCWLIADGWRGG